MLQNNGLFEVLPLELWDKIISYFTIWDILRLSQTQKAFETYIAKQEAFLEQAFHEFLPNSGISKVKGTLQGSCYDIELDKAPGPLKLRFPNILTIESNSNTLRQFHVLHQISTLQRQSTKAFQSACMFQTSGAAAEYKQQPPVSMELRELAMLQLSWRESYPLPVDFVFLLTKYGERFWYNTYFGYMDNLWHGMHWGNTRSGPLRLIHLNRECTQSEAPAVFLEIAGRFQVPTLSVLLDVSAGSPTYGQVFIKEGIQEPKWVDWSVTDFLVRISDYACEDWVEADLFTVIDHLFLSQNSSLESRISL
ncbi:hypothetical protein K493DRAFT_307763 [Basidiobolus meristosporus CBS 931.73]|uniref:F-box domain-containing protein n=1 Tax=Basidiobolus meristosporus CBS 931.73 TaxID=1314790 RepID=A0A1Y1XAJ9_9FUNG|nr:hypothetical protein K493DRAFT_307763 [Basidiobolus meristosporus CBS 931.73]|eukprot:ORX82801.1 hypothetical protein K493DRAFT_307763 [Basidiobolus meristosporus CBS 931.73]